MNIGAIVAVPMLKENRPIGAIAVARSQSGRFPVQQIELPKTFADQAVIAIENTRLFEEVQARTRELTERTQKLTETLKYQTATSEVLGVISRSPSQTQSVFDAIVATVAGLCRAEYALIFKRESDERYHVAAANNAKAEWLRFSTDNPSPRGRSTLCSTLQKSSRVNSH